MHSAKVPSGWCDHGVVCLTQTGTILTAATKTAVQVATNGLAKSLLFLATHRSFRSTRLLRERRRCFAASGCLMQVTLFSYFLSSLSHVIQFHPISSRLVPSLSSLSHPISSHLIPPHPISSHLVTFHPVSCHMSYVICHMAYVICQKSNILCPMSYVLCLCHMSYVICHMSYVICHMSYVQGLMSYVLCPMSYVLSSHPNRSHVMSCHPMPSHVMSCHAIPCHPMSCLSAPAVQIPRRTRQTIPLDIKNMLHSVRSEMTRQEERICATIIAQLARKNSANDVRPTTVDSRLHALEKKKTAEKRDCENEPRRPNINACNSHWFLRRIERKKVKLILVSGH